MGFQEVYAVEENYLDEAYDSFFRPSEISNQFDYEQTSSGRDDVVESLYKDAGKGRHQ